MTYEQALAQLTGPGGLFEVVVEDVRGRPMKSFKGRERSLREKVAASARFGDRIFLVQGQRRLSYARFARLVWGGARVLERDFGLRKGDRLAVLAYNSPDWIVSLFAATSLGGIGVGLNGWWSTDEIAYGIEDSGSRFLVVDERLYPRVAPLRGRLPGLERIFTIGDSTPPGTTPVAELLVEEEHPPEVPIDEDDPWVLLYTSGTTGRPKGCITTHRGTIAQATGIVLSAVASALSGAGVPLTGAGEPPTTLVCSPLFHVGGLHTSLGVGITTGARLVFLEGRFDPEQAMQVIERERVTVWGAIPTMLHRVVHHPRIGEYDLSSLQNVSFGGAPTPSETIDRARELLPVELSMTNAYGLTETHGVVTMNAGKELSGRKTSAGRPLPVLDLRIVGESGRALPPGELGEVTISGPTVTPGYWNRPEASAESVRDGWLHTGDLGYVDADGFLFLVDRKKDMILRGGENVYCVEIENCLCDHPELDEAAVVGVPDAELGERVKAVVRRVPGARLAAEGVRRHVAARLARFKVPEIVEFTDEPLPRNAAGKLLKNLLRERPVPCPGDAQTS